MLFGKIIIVLSFNVILLLAEAIIINIAFPIIIAFELVSLNNAVPIAALLILGGICLANALLIKTGTYQTMFKRMLRERKNAGI